jgi:membrane protease YdiL (CAAX protease family)
MTWGDHLYVVAVLLIVFPVGGAWAYRRLIARTPKAGEDKLVREYKLTLLWLAGLIVGAALAWIMARRAWSDMGLTIPRGEAASSTVFIVCLFGAALCINPLSVFVSRRRDASLIKAYGALRSFMPATARQYFWALVVSVAAGVCEEIAYRGYLHHYLTTWLPPWGVIAAAAVVFGFAHLYQGVAGMLMTAILGAVFGYFYLDTGSLIAPIVMHALLDMSAMTTAFVVLSRNTPVEAPAAANA